MGESSEEIEAQAVALRVRAAYDHADSTLIVDSDGTVLGPLMDVARVAVQTVKDQPWADFETRDAAWRVAVRWAKDVRPEQRKAVREMMPEMAKHLDELARRWGY